MATSKRTETENEFPLIPYKGCMIIDGGPVEGGDPGDCRIIIRNAAEEELTQSIFYISTDPISINKGIVKAKEWIDENLGGNESEQNEAHKKKASKKKDLIKYLTDHKGFDVFIEYIGEKKHRFLIGVKPFKDFSRPVHTIEFEPIMGGTDVGEMDIDKAKDWIDALRRCRVCGCTQYNCKQCIEKISFFKPLSELITDDIDITLRILQKDGKMTVGIFPVNDLRLPPVNTFGYPSKIDEIFLSEVIGKVKDIPGYLTRTKVDISEKGFSSNVDEVKKAATNQPPAPVKDTKKSSKNKLGPKKKSVPVKKKYVPKKPTQKPGPKKPGPKPLNKKKVAPKKPSGSFMQPLTPSLQLAEIVGVKPIVRTEAVKKIWVYIKANNLQDKKNRRMINLDAKLKEVFGDKPQVSMFDMAKLLYKHLPKPKKPTGSKPGPIPKTKAPEKKKPVIKKKTVAEPPVEKEKPEVETQSLF